MTFPRFATALLALVAIVPLQSCATGPIEGVGAAPKATLRVSGHFDVELRPEAQAPDVPNGRMTFRKTFHGGLQGRSVGEMLSNSDGKSPSGAYVALERFTGQLGDRSGSFYLIHRGIMDGARTQLEIAVVPGSGTGQLTGIEGVFTLDMSSKNHAFTFDYGFATPGATGRSG